MKRLMVALLCSLFFTSVTFADTATVNGITWTYSVSNGKASIYTSSSQRPAISSSTAGAITIPSMLGGYPVTSIGSYAFYNCYNLTSVTISEGVTTIGERAFYNCRRLTSVTIPSSVTSIGDYAFYGCESLKRVCIEDAGAWVRIQFGGYKANPLECASEGLYLNGEKLTSVNILEGVTSIPNSAFRNCRALTSVTIPSNVTTIGSSAFSGCSSLTLITIPEGVTSIGGSAFSGCSSLTSITIPSSVTSIGASAFSGCSNLWKDVNGVQYESDSRVILIDVPTSLTGMFIIPSSVRFIHSAAFYGCTGLTSVTIPSSVTTIGSDAFSGCKGLTSITIPSSVTTIGYYAFSSCIGLTGTLTIPEGVTTLEGGIIDGCTNIKRLVLPSTLTSWGDYEAEGVFYSAFAHSSIEEVILSEGLISIGRGAFAECPNLTSVMIPNSVTSIGEAAFFWCTALTSVTIPTNVTSIGYVTFSGCKGLTSVTIPSSVTSIDDSAFEGVAPTTLTAAWIPGGGMSTENLETLIIPEGVTSIGSSAFSGCQGLTSVTIPSSVTSIGSSAFSSLYSLKRVCIEDVGAWVRIQFEGYEANPLEWASEGLYLDGEKLTTVRILEGVTSITDSAFRNCSALTSVTIPEGVTSIGNSAFSGCSSLSSVVIPEGVTSIGSSAFEGCTGLTSVTIPSSVTSIGDYAFWGVAPATLTAPWIPNYMFSENLKTLIIPEGVTTITKEAFYDCGSLTSVTIPSSVTSIGDYAFYGCSNLPSVRIPEDVTSIGNCAFHSCSSLTSVTIPEGVTSIGAGAFFECTALKSITIPSSVTFIGENAFMFCSLERVYIDDVGGWLRIQCEGEGANPLRWCADGGLYLNGEKLTTLKIPEGVTSIRDSAFSGCTSLTSVAIPEGVTSISNGAFRSCSALTSTTIPSSVTSIGDYAFYGCSNLPSVTIPEGVTSIGNSAFSGCSSLTSVTIPSSVIFVGQSAFKDCPLYSLVFQGQVPNGFINAFKSYAWSNFNYPTEYAKEWQSTIQCMREVVGPYTQANVSVFAKMTTPKTMSVTYTIHSEVKQMAKVYALAFEDGVRSFAKVVPVKTATADSPTSIPNGREVATNTPHTFIWNVPADWDTDLSKVMVEILVQEGELLPLELITIPGDATTPDMTITRNALPQSELFNALLWCYASGDTALTNANGILKANGTQIANGVSLSSSGTQATALLNYLYGKMGYKVLSGANLSYAEEMTELDFSSSGLTQVAVKVATSSVSEE